MARGWESKDVESQIDSRQQNHRFAAPKLNPGQLKTAREREDLLLSRTRVLTDLESATNPGYRDMLQRSLQFLDEKLKALDPSKPDRPE